MNANTDIDSLQGDRPKRVRKRGILKALQNQVKYWNKNAVEFINFHCLLILKICDVRPREYSLTFNTGVRATILDLKAYIQSICRVWE